MSPRSDPTTVASAIAECGMQKLADWLPAERRESLRERLTDLSLAAIAAYAEVDSWRLPDLSAN